MMFAQHRDLRVQDFETPVSVRRNAGKSSSQAVVSFPWVDLLVAVAIEEPVAAMQSR